MDIHFSLMKINTLIFFLLYLYEKKYPRINQQQEHNKLQKKLNMSKFEICLKYALSNKYIDKVIVGIDNSKQFKMLIKSAGYLKTKINSVDASKEINLINPSKW